MKVLIGVEHELLSYGITQLIKDVHPMESIVIVRSAEELIHALRQYSYDLIVVDSKLSGTGGLTSVLTSLENQSPTSKKVFMFRQSVCKLEKAINQEKIDGLFYEQSSLAELMIFFDKVLRGERAILRMHADEEFNEGRTTYELSKREEEVFNLRVRGYSVLDSAEILKISPKTVENHRRNIKRKLNITKNNEWFEWGERMGMI